MGMEEKGIRLVEALENGWTIVKAFILTFLNKIIRILVGSQSEINSNIILKRFTIYRNSRYEWNFINKKYNFNGLVDDVSTFGVLFGIRF